MIKDIVQKRLHTITKMILRYYKSDKALRSKTITDENNIDKAFTSKVITICTMLIKG